MGLRKAASIILFALVIFSGAFLAYQELVQGSSQENGGGSRIGQELLSKEATPDFKEVVSEDSTAANAAASVDQNNRNTSPISQSPDQKAVREVKDESSAAPSDEGQAAQKADLPEITTALQPKTQTGGNKVVAYYFHTKYTCSSCYITENYIKEALGQFPQQLQKGTLEFRSIDVDRPENRHFLQDYQVAAQSLVLTLQSGGTVSSVNLSDVFQYSGDKTKLIQYVKGEVEKLLREVG